MTHDRNCESEFIDGAAGRTNCACEYRALMHRWTDMELAIKGPRSRRRIRRRISAEQLAYAWRSLLNIIEAWTQPAIPPLAPRNDNDSTT